MIVDHKSRYSVWRFAFVLMLSLFALAAAPLSADEIRLGDFPRGKWLDVTWQAYWTFGDGTIKLLDVRDAEIYDFTGVVQNMKVTSLPTGGIRLTFDCAQARRSYLFEKTSATSQMQMVIRQKGSSIAYRIAMPPVSERQLTDYKAAVISERPAEVAKIVASIQDIPSSAMAARQAEKTRARTASLLEVAATADFDRLDAMGAEAEKEGLLDAMIQSLESEAAKTDAPPSVFISLSVLYGRKNLKTQSYAALELAENAPVPPNVSLNVSLLHGRKKLLAGAPDANAFMVGDIELMSVPEEVPVFLDGVEKGKGSITLTKVPAGKHVISCEHPNYRPVSMDVEVGVGQTLPVLIGVTMKTCLLNFIPSIVGYDVYIDGFPCKEDTMITVMPGKHTIELKRQNFKTLSVQCEGKPGEEVIVNVLNQNREPAEYPWTIETVPSGVAVSIDGTAIGVTPLRDVPVLATEHEVTCAWGGKVPLSGKKSFLLKEGQTGGSLVMKEPFVIPTKTIKLDGKNDDWADVEAAGGETFGLDADPDPKLDGTWLTKSMACQDEKYVYWYMEFADGKPKHSLGYSYSMLFKRSATDNMFIALKLENQKAKYPDKTTWKPKIVSSYTRGQYDERADLWDNAGSSSHYKIGQNFIEARFPRENLLRELKENEPVFLVFDSDIERTYGRNGVSWGEVILKWR